MNRFNNNGKSVWGGHRPDSFINGVSRRPNFNNRCHEVFQPQAIDDSELEGRPNGDLHHDVTVNGKLDRLLDKMEKFDQWRDDTDRRFESLDPFLSREAEPPLGFDDADNGEYEEFRRRKSGDRGHCARNPNGGYRDGEMEKRRRRSEWGRSGSGWDPGNRYVRAQFGDFLKQFDTPTSCWDPPHRYQSSAAVFDKNQVSMKPPRFHGSDATNWIYRVHYYFDHVMMPEAWRLHYAVMLFDPPASEWVFNYCANNDFVTWQKFLEDVRHRFDTQSFKDYFGLIADVQSSSSIIK